jgi:hypothetical protein
MKQNKIILNADRVFLIEFTETIIKQKSFCWEWVQSCYDVSYVLYKPHTKKEEKQKKIEVFFISMTDIEKALTSQKKTDLRTILWSLSWVLNVFDHTMTEKLLKRRRHRSSNWTKRVNEKESKVLWGSLYNMMREKLLVLHKTLTELLNKQFIQVSNSSAAVSVLFMKVRRWTFILCELLWLELNHSKESLLSFIDIWDSAKHQQAQWYIKLNVIAAFHKIWIAAEDKWKTAFHMRYRLYEWMMTSFELVNVSSTFQRYINWVLQNFLNEFCSVYEQYYSIFTDELLHQHRNHVQRYTTWLWEVLYKLTLTNVSLKSSQSSI